MSYSGQGSGSGPHPYGRWNYLNRKGNATVYNGDFQGKQNQDYAQQLTQGNQGYGTWNNTAMFPQASFSTCRYPTGHMANRRISHNNWHTRQSEADAPVFARSFPANKEFDPITGRALTQEEEKSNAPAEVNNLELLEEMGAQPIRGPRQHSRAADHQKTWDVHYETKLRPREVYRPSRKLGSLTDSGVFWSERRRGYVQINPDSHTIPPSDKSSTNF